MTDPRPATLLALLLSTAPAPAHEAVTGWLYPRECCGNLDCREVPASSVLERPGGFLVPSGELLPYRDKRLRDSPDGLYHWCTVGGTNAGRTLCLYIPPRSF